MVRMFETREITKLLDVLIGQTEAVGETNEDNRRLDNLKTLIDVTNWCLDGLEFAMASGRGRPEYSMAKIGHTAQCALDEYGRWIADILDEQMADRKTENSSEKPNNCEECKHWNDTEDGCADRHGCKTTEDWQDWKDRMWAEAIVTEPTTEDSSTVKPQNYCDDCLYCDTCDSKEFFYACTSKATISKMEQVDEPQKCSVNGRPYDCGNCEYFKCTADEPQTSCKTCRYGEVDEGYVRCAYYSKSTEQDEPQLTPNYCGSCKHREVPCGDLPCDVCHGYSNYEPKDEPQTEMPRCSVNGTPFDECGFCEYFNCDTCKCEADVPQAERSE